MNSDVEAVEIPQVLVERLQELGPHFIRVAKRGKEPIDKGWTTSAMEADNPMLKSWLQQGGNYGVVGGFGLVIVDLDHEELKAIARERLPQTFTVESPGSKGWHLYYRCDLERPIRLRDKDGENIGDIQGQGKMVVGPGSVHPNGGVYHIIDDRPLAQVTREQLIEAFKDYVVPEREIEKVEALARMEEQENDIRLSILQVVPLAGLKRQGDEFYGPHPVHGSKTGRNFWVNPNKNCWHCFRHCTGGGPLLWLAVEGRIIDCSEAGPGALRGEIFKKVLEKARERGLIEGEREENFPKLGDFRLGVVGKTVFLYDKDGGAVDSFRLHTLNSGAVKKRLSEIAGIDLSTVSKCVANLLLRLKMGGHTREENHNSKKGGADGKTADPEAFKKVLRLLKDPNLPLAIEFAFREQGLVGETRNAFQTFFDMLSSLTEEPVNRRWSGRPSQGKTTIVVKVAELFPPEMVIVRAGLTKKAVWHMPGSEEIDEHTRGLNLERKILILLEESESKEFLDEAKPLLSHDMRELKYEFTVKEEGKLVTYVQVLRGWPVYIGITTEPELREEQQTRALIGTPERGEHKYRAVIGADAERVAEPWRNNQMIWTPLVREAIRCLRPLKVWIPWLPIVAEEFPSREAKSMREWKFFRTFLESITLLFQYQLPHITFNGEEYVVAPPFVLELALLVGEAAFRETLSGLEADVHAFYDHLVSKGGPWTYKQLLKEYENCFGESVSETTLRRRYTDKLLDQGLLELDDSKKPYKLSIGQKAPTTSTNFQKILEKVKSGETKQSLALKTSSTNQNAHTTPTLPDGTAISWSRLWDYLYSLDLVEDVRKLFKRSKEEEYPKKGFFSKMEEKMDVLTKETGKKPTSKEDLVQKLYTPRNCGFPLDVHLWHSFQLPSLLQSFTRRRGQPNRFSPTCGDCVHHKAAHCIKHPEWVTVTWAAAYAQSCGHFKPKEAGG